VSGFGVRGVLISANPDSTEMFVPLRHEPGHAQVDFGEALAVIGGEERKIHFFAMDLPHSDACLVQAYPAESSEAFCDGHNVSFELQLVAPITRGLAIGEASRPATRASSASRRRTRVKSAVLLPTHGLLHSLTLTREAWRQSQTRLAPAQTCSAGTRNTRRGARSTRSWIWTSFAKESRP